MHYVRFVKFPQLELERSKGGSSYQVSTLVTIETDLGEAFFAEDISLHASFRADTPERQLLASQKVSWKGGMRLVKVQMNFQTQAANPTGILCVSAPDRRADDLRKEIFPGGILSIWSPPLSLNGELDKFHVERKLFLTDSKVLPVWEETGESIARHIWDGGLAFASYAALFHGKSAAFTSSLPSFHRLLHRQQEQPRQQLRFLELGAGVGIAGLTLGVLLEQSKPRITITDLEAAQNIANRNLAHSRTMVGPPEMVRFETLDWDEPLPEWALEGELDVVFFADCIYNTVSIPLLVKTLSRIAERWPNVLVIFAYKIRHDSENMFFELARKAGFETREHVLFGDTVDMYTMGLARDPGDQ